MQMLNDEKHRELYQACCNGRAEFVKDALANNNLFCNPFYNNAEVVTVACQNNHIEIVKILLQCQKPFDPPSHSRKKRQYAIIEAARRGYTDIVARLLQDKRINPSVMANEALRQACRCNHRDIVKLLISDKRVDVSDRKNAFLAIALKNHNVELANILLPCISSWKDSEHIACFLKQYPVQVSRFFRHGSPISALRLPNMAHALETAICYNDTEAVWNLIIDHAYNPYLRQFRIAANQTRNPTIISLFLRTPLQSTYLDSVFLTEIEMTKNRTNQYFTAINTRLYRKMIQASLSSLAKLCVSLHTLYLPTLLLFELFDIATPNRSKMLTLFNTIDTVKKIIMTSTETSKHVTR